MKPELQRITATLDKLNQEYHTKEIAPSFTVNRENMNKTKDKSLTFSLPKIKPIPLTNHHNTPNPALARNILKEIDSKIAIWEQKSHQIQQEIQELYLEGPIVDGWLESQVQSFDTNTPVHSTSEVICQVPKAGYRLCGLDESGRLWTRVCPAEEVAELSIAIARYHKLKELLYKKRQLETRLKQIAETLAILHSNITGSN